jgi:hypothetical protein
VDTFRPIASPDDDVVDYPHSDSNWPKSRELVMEQTAGLAPDVVEKVVGGDAKRLLGLA